VYAKIDKLGFIETPYYQVEQGVVKKFEDPIYLSAEQEENKIIAQATTLMSDDGVITNPKVKARSLADYPIIDKEKVDLIDTAPNQIASIAASLIPFLEHDDANRALMGSNMMRQAVPLLNSEAPIVGTGIEGNVARDSRVLINAEGEGVVEYVDAREIIIRYSRDEKERLVSFDDDVKTYQLLKFMRTNQNTSINLRPIVKKGDKVTKGQVLCEGYATEDGELALGRNLKVAFMPWKGYNFEDAIVISEKVVKEDIFTSVHIEEFTLEVRDTKRGVEELTNDIPNISAEATKDLDENGIIRIGAEITAGDILIGKITPKGESDPTPEEKLLRAIFGDKETVINLLGGSTTYIERTHLTMHHFSARLTRKSLAFSKKLPAYQAAAALQDAIYNFVRPLKTLRQERLDNTHRRWQPRTPAMAANVTNSIWTVKELLTIIPLPASVNT